MRVQLQQLSCSRRTCRLQAGSRHARLSTRLSVSGGMFTIAASQQLFALNQTNGSDLSAAYKAACTLNRIAIALEHSHGSSVQNSSSGSNSDSSQTSRDLLRQQLANHLVASKGWAQFVAAPLPALLKQCTKACTRLLKALQVNEGVMCFHCSNRGNCAAPTHKQHSAALLSHMSSNHAPRVCASTCAHFLQALPAGEQRFSAANAAKLQDWLSSHVQDLLTTVVPRCRVLFLLAASAARLWPGSCLAAPTSHAWMPPAIVLADKLLQALGTISRLQGAGISCCGISLTQASDIRAAGVAEALAAALDYATLYSLDRAGYQLLRHGASGTVVAVGVVDHPRRLANLGPMPQQPLHIGVRNSMYAPWSAQLSSSGRRVIVPPAVVTMNGILLPSITSMLFCYYGDQLQRLVAGGVAPAARTRASVSTVHLSSVASQQQPPQPVVGVSSAPVGPISSSSQGSIPSAGGSSSSSKACSAAASGKQVWEAAEGMLLLAADSLRLQDQQQLQCQQQQTSRHWQQQFYQQLQAMGFSAQLLAEVHKSVSHLVWNSTSSSSTSTSSTSSNSSRQGGEHARAPAGSADDSSQLEEEARAQQKATLEQCTSAVLAAAIALVGGKIGHEAALALPADAVENFQQPPPPEVQQAPVSVDQRLVMQAPLLLLSTVLTDLQTSGMAAVHKIPTVLLHIELLVMSWTPAEAGSSPLKLLTQANQHISPETAATLIKPALLVVAGVTAVLQQLLLLAADAASPASSDDDVYAVQWAMISCNYLLFAQFTVLWSWLRVATPQAPEAVLLDNSFALANTMLVCEAAVRLVAATVFEVRGPALPQEPSASSSSSQGQPHAQQKSHRSGGVTDAARQRLQQELEQSGFFFTATSVPSILLPALSNKSALQRTVAEHQLLQATVALMLTGAKVQQLHATDVFSFTTGYHMCCCIAMDAATKAVCGQNRPADSSSDSSPCSGSDSRNSQSHAVAASCLPPALAAPFVSAARFVCAVADHVLLLLEESPAAAATWLQAKEPVQLYDLRTLALDTMSQQQARWHSVSRLVRVVQGLLRRCAGAGRYRLLARAVATASTCNKCSGTGSCSSCRSTTFGWTHNPQFPDISSGLSFLLTSKAQPPAAADPDELSAALQQWAQDLRAWGAYVCQILPTAFACNNPASQPSGCQ